MSTEMIPYLFSFVWPATLLLLVFCTVLRKRAWFPIMAALAIGIVFIPLGGIPLGRWLTGLCANFSLPLLALLIAMIARKAFDVELLGKDGMRAAMWFGALAGSLLFPMALGLGSFDPYPLGWNFSWLFAGSGVLTAVLLWCGNRFGLVLLSAIVAYHFGLLESNNYWDYLVDPVYFLISLVAVGRRFLRPSSRQNNCDTPESSGAAA